MAWTASIQKKRSFPDRFEVLLRYTDGVKKVLESVRIDRVNPGAQLRSHVRGALARLEGLESFDPPLGPFDPIESPPPPPDLPTPAQIYANRVEELRRWENAIELGSVIEVEQPRIALTRQFLIDNFRMSFLPAFSS